MWRDVNEELHMQLNNLVYSIQFSINMSFEYGARKSFNFLKMECLVVALPFGEFLHVKKYN